MRCDAGFGWKFWLMMWLYGNICCIDKILDSMVIIVEGGVQLWLWCICDYGYLLLSFFVWVLDKLLLYGYWNVNKFLRNARGSCFVAGNVCWFSAVLWLSQGSLLYIFATVFRWRFNWQPLNILVTVCCLHWWFMTGTVPKIYYNGLSLGYG